MKLQLYRLGLTVCLALLQLSGWAQINTEFGKNRVQFHEFSWFQYETKHFITYYDRKDQNLAKFAFQVAEGEYENLQNLMEYRLGGKIALVLYTDITDLKQSNIGKEDIFYNTGGVTKIVENKVFIHFNGDHNDFRRQIREGIAKVLLSHMVFGDNLQEILQNNMLLSLPVWFTEGIVSYVAQDWTVAEDLRLRDKILSGDYTDFQRLADEDPKLAGHSFWFFVSQLYDKSTVSNLLYLTRINRSIESGFLYVTGTPFNVVAEGWHDFYRERYEQDVQGLIFPDLKSEQVFIPAIKKRPRVTKVALSPDGKTLAYVTNDIGKTRVYLKLADEAQPKLIFKSGTRNNLQATDYGYPLIAWSATGKNLAIYYEKQDDIKLITYNLKDETKTYTPVEGVERVLSVDYINDKDMVITAILGGYSNLFTFSANRGLKPISKDFWDYRDASYAYFNGKKGIVFSSNRPNINFVQESLDTILPLGNYDLFWYDLDNPTAELYNITNTPNANEFQVKSLDSTHLVWISDAAGHHTLHTGMVDTVFAYYNRVYKFKDGSEVVMHADSVLEIEPNSLDTSFTLPVYLPKTRSWASQTFARGINDFSLANNGMASYLFQKDNRYVVYTDKLDWSKQITEKNTVFRQRRSAKVTEKANKPPKVEVVAPVEPIVPEPDNVRGDTTALDSLLNELESYLFQSRFDDIEIPRPLQDPAPEPVKQAEPAAQMLVNEQGSVLLQAPNAANNTPTKPNVPKFVSTKVVPYKVRFRINDLVTQMDNSIMFGGLLPNFAGSQGYQYPPMGFLVKTSIEDVFEDHTLEGGMRIPFSFNGMEYFLTYNNRKRRLDQTYSVYRRGVSNAYNIEGVGVPADYAFRAKTITHLVQAQYKWPFDIYRSVRATVTARDDKFVPLATDPISLAINTYSEQRIGLRLEYVFDNAITINTNILNGTRYKFTAEFYNRFQANLANNRLNIDPSVGLMGVLGVDARHYIPLFKHSVLAMRAAGSSSFGSDKFLYFLGGVENWLLPKYNNEIPVPDDQSFSYQVLATNLRGFANNIRNGNSYALANIEARVPLFNYFSKRPLRSNFLRTFQLVAFMDAGTAWQGLNPFSSDNPLNTKVITNAERPQDYAPVTVTVQYFRNPLVMGAGLGARAMLFGYFIKLDYAWGIETGRVQKPIFYFSIGQDF